MTAIIGMLEELLLPARHAQAESSDLLVEVRAADTEGCCFR